MLYIALDGLNISDAINLFKKTKYLATGFKIGPEAFARIFYNKSDLLEGIAEQSNLFIDFKLHDIPQTVINSIEQLSLFNPKILTVHSVVAPSAAKARTPAKVVGVTNLTSEKANVVEILEKVEYCRLSGIAGVVCSPNEVGTIKSSWPDGFCVVPGIRPSWYNKQDDQQRTNTPKYAKEQGANVLVIGRPITQDSDPEMACRRVLEELE